MPCLRMCRRPPGHFLAPHVHLRTCLAALVLSLLVLSLFDASAWAQGEAGSADWLLAAAGSHDSAQVESGPDAAAYAGGQNPAGAAAYAGKGKPGGDMASVSVLGVLGRLALIAVLIYAAVWGLRQWRERGVALPHSGRGGLIRVRESVALGGGGRLYVVQFGRRSLLISAVGDQVSLLTGNSASEMHELDTSSLPAQRHDARMASRLDFVSDVHVGHDGSEGNGARLRAENQRHTADWESRRDALVRALHGSVES